MPRTARVAGLAIATSLGVASLAGAYSRDGVYAPLSHLSKPGYQSPYVLIDGLPVVMYDGTPRRNPVTTAQYGLIHWSIWRRSRDPEALRAARRAAAWLRRAQDRGTGAWHYDFEYTLHGTTHALSPGWSSALAQGQAVSLLARVYRRAGDRRDLRAIRSALRPLRLPVLDGGLQREHLGGPWFEEYPTARPSLVLNGHLFTVLGLHDAADLDREAERMFRRSVSVAVRSLPRYDDPERATSHYADLTAYGAESYPAPPNYVPIIRRLLLALDHVHPHQHFRLYAGRWHGQPAPG